jgi:hypothetical protein
MTPREVDEMTPSEYRAFVDYANRELRAAARAAKKRR